MSDRPTERARMGYRGPAGGRGGPPPRPGRPAAPRRRVHDPPVTPAASTGARTRAHARAERLLDSLLDPRQRAERARSGRWWVATPDGWVRMGGSPHDIRFRPSSHPEKEWSLCVVPARAGLPPADVWANLLLVASVTPDRFFAAAHVDRSPPLPRAPAPPPG